jgi:hypothetical protein
VLWIRITLMRIRILPVTLMLIRILLVTLMRIRIQLFFLIRIRIQLITLMRILPLNMMRTHADPDHNNTACYSPYSWKKTQTSESHLLSWFEVRLPVLEFLAVALLQLLQLGRLVLHQHLPLLVLEKFLLGTAY